MTSKNINALVTKEQINLLVSSECIKRYNNLYNLLKHHKNVNKAIYPSDIKHLKSNDNETYSILMYSFKEIIEEGSREWKQGGFVGTNYNICQLCGSNKLTLNYKIVNIVNKNQMIIGSSCINKFPLINMDNINLNDEVKRAKKIDRINKLNNRYENILDIIQSWKTFYREFPIILPKHFDDSFTNLYIKSQDFYNKFVESKLNLCDIEIFNTYISEFSILKSNAEQFYRNNKSNRYICDTPIIKWINKQKNSNYIKNKIMINDGIINRSIAKEIYSLDFINKFKREITEYFEASGFEVSEITEDLILLKYKTYENIKIDLTLSLKEFSLKFSDIFFNKLKNNESSFIINKFKFLWTLDNLENYIYILNNRIRSTGYSLSSVFREGTHINLVRIEKDKQFLELNGHKFLDIIKIYLDKEPAVIKKNLVIYLASERNWKDIKDDKKYNKHDILDAMKNRKV